MTKINWDDLFMTEAYLAAMKSKDQNTHVGAVIVGPDNEVRSTGYNSFVRGLNDDVPDRQIPPEKYFWFEHGERNAIYNAGRVGIPLKGCRMYTNGIPCADCARGIIQSGIIEVIVDKSWDEDNSEKWAENARRSLIMFAESGVNIRYWEGRLLKIEKFRRGKILDL
jgi:dCMP deaminase